MRLLWDGILKAGLWLGRMQAMLLLTLFFLLVCWPMGLLVRLKDPLRMRPGPGWLPRKPLEPTLDRFTHPF